jgi:glycosyltransferase involved in cell wall biosynthesis
MKILSITSTYPRFVGDGVGSFIQSISEKLSDYGHNLYVIAPDNHKAEYQWQNKVHLERVKYIWPKKFAKLGHGESLRSDIQLKWYSYILVLFFSLFSLLRIVINPKYSNVDIIYAHWLLPSGLIGAIISRIYKIPLVIHLHGSDVFVSERYKIFRPFVQYILHSSSKIIACSKDLAERIELFGSKNIEVIPYGVDINLFYPNYENSKKRITTSTQQKSVTAVGRLVNKKGFSYLILAAEKVVSGFPQCVFQIIGDGDQRENLVKLCNSLNLRNNVIFLGNLPRSKISEMLRITDVFALPSVVDEKGNVDGLPNVLLEAMSSGCAVIASRIGGVPDIIEDGVNGLLVEPRNYEQLSQAILYLLKNDDLREDLGKAARNTVEKNFTWDIIVSRIEKVLEETLCTYYQ